MNLATISELNARHKLHYRTAFQGLPISVENRRGSIRRGCNKQWGCWATLMHIPYGYIRGTKGIDGDEVDCFVGEHVEAKFAYVMHTRRAPAFKDYDEDKVMLGFKTAAEAKQAFLKHFADSRFFGGMDSIPMEEFKKKVLQTKSKPQKLVRTKLEESMQRVAAEGEPDTYGGGKGHIDPMPTFHPPSLKKADKVPADNPNETDDRFLDVTKRKEAQKFRKDLTKRHPTLGGIPPNTAVNHQTSFPFVTN